MELRRNKQELVKKEEIICKFPWEGMCDKIDINAKKKA